MIRAHEIGLDDPLRLEDALALAYPAGGMTLSGLRREIAKGTLVVELTAGKHFTTLRAIQHMRKLCRDRAKARIFGSTRQGTTPTATSRTRPPGSSLMEEGALAQAALRLKLAKRRSSSRSK